MLIQFKLKVQSIIQFLCFSEYGKIFVFDLITKGHRIEKTSHKGSIKTIIQYKKDSFITGAGDMIIKECEYNLDNTSDVISK